MWERTMKPLTATMDQTGPDSAQAIQTAPATMLMSAPVRRW